MRYAAVLLAGCFKPTLHANVKCGPDGFCPEGQVCKVDGLCHPPDEPAVIDAPFRYNHAFVTRKADYRLSQFLLPSDVDRECMIAAQAAGLSGTFIAWVSTPTTPVGGRVMSATGWVRSDGEPFAQSASALLAGQIESPLRLDEFGADVGENEVVATATDASGNAGTNDCFGAGAGTQPVLIGYPDGGIQEWTAGFAGGTCAQLVRLDCLQTDAPDPVPAPMHDGRRIFLSTATTTGTVGRPALDALCASEAAAATYAGTFIALVALKSQSALDQLTAGADWVRPDGVVALKGDTKGIVAPIEVTTAKEHRHVAVWGGATSFATTAALDGSQNCNDWTGGTVARTGNAARSSTAESFGGFVGAQNCGTSLNVYCVQR